jgi:LuxR family maltose regulon positive regulatory protein
VAGRRARRAALVGSASGAAALCPLRGRRARALRRAPLPGPLTPSELTILRYLATGANAVRIAQLLHRSPHTVRTHLRNAYAKLGAHGRADALAKARALGLL